MKTIKLIFSSLLIGAVAVVAQARTVAGKASHSAHSAAHQELLANAKSRIDKYDDSAGIRGARPARDLRVAPPACRPDSSRLMGEFLPEGRPSTGYRAVQGAKGPSAFDCSGFTSYVYRQFGYKLSPSSRAQYLEGTPVDRKDLRKGDLVFFTSRSSGKNVGHVGIVVSADNETGKFKFIHASIRGVKISDFEGYYVGRYIGAKRIINN